MFFVRNPSSLLLLLVPSLTAAHQLPDYAKTELMIPMRDGVKLYTAVYSPVGVAGRHPILLERTPYSAGPYGTQRKWSFDGSQRFRQAGYIFVYQDVRGKYMSEGTYENIRPTLSEGAKGIDESTDAYDTIDYLVKHVPENNGKVGIWGISYPGFYAAAAMRNSHPALKAASPQAPVSDWFLGDDFHHNGALFLQDAFGFLSGFGQVRKAPGPSEPDAPAIDWGPSGAYDFYLKLGSVANADTRYLKGSVPFWSEMISHSSYDAWWRARNLPSKLTNVHCAVLTVGGLFDAEDMWGALHVAQSVSAQNPRVSSSMIMGPWYHGMWAGEAGARFGDIDFNQETGTWFREQIEFPFFDQYLRGTKASPLPKATLFETGTNKWRGFDAWPPKHLATKTVFLTDGKTLAESSPKHLGIHSYVADPANPTHYLADKREYGRPAEYMIADQRFAQSREDVLTFRGSALKSGLTVAGPIQVVLNVATSGTDGDWVVKVIDEYPEDAGNNLMRKPMASYQMLLRGDVMRGRYRSGFATPKAMQPDVPTTIKFTMNDVLHTFLPGHRIVVQVQPYWFPLVERNPNQFIDLATAKDKDFVPARVKVFTGGSTPSKIVFGVLQGS